MKFCYAKDCNIEVAHDRLMCWDHWRRVPRNIQDKVWTKFHTNWEGYKHARDTARLAIMVKEGREPTDAQVARLARYGIGPDAYPL